MPAMNMDGSMIVRLVAVVAIAVALTATAMHFAREDGASVEAPMTTTTETPRTDAPRDALRRCRQLGEAATRDADCLAVWDQNRRRFLTPAGGN